MAKRTHLSMRAHRCPACRRVALIPRRRFEETVKAHEATCPGSRAEPVAVPAEPRRAA